MTVSFSCLDVVSQLPEGQETQAVGGGVVCTEVCPASRSVEGPLVPQEGLEELLRVRGEFVNGLVLARYLLGSGKELLFWSVEQDSHARTRYVVVVLELLPPLRLEGSSCVVEAQIWL